MNKEMAAKTAKWWRERLSIGGGHKNGDDSNDGVIFGLLADLNGMQNEPTDKQLDKFEKVLTRLLVKDKSKKIYLECDYDPCEMLYQAATKAGISRTVFPWKTATMTTKEEFYVADGYGERLLKVE